LYLFLDLEKGDWGKVWNDLENIISWRMGHGNVLVERYIPFFI
jgi:hypothetical protein